MPIGMPGWPELAASTASIASIRIAFASRRRGGRAARASEWVLLTDIVRAIGSDGDASGLESRPVCAAAWSVKRKRIVAYWRRAAQPAPGRTAARICEAWHGAGTVRIEYDPGNFSSCPLRDGSQLRTPYSP